MNPHAPSYESNNHRRELLTSRWRVGRVLLTAACGIGLTLVMWILLVMLLDHRFTGYDSFIWSGSLWMSAMTCTGLVASSRHSARPVLSCTVAFAAFAVIYMICEGAVFGNVSTGGDPSITEFVVLNLVCLPGGVFTAAQIGHWVGRKRRRAVTSA